MSLPVNSIAAVVVGGCFACGGETVQCAECAVVVLIDPDTDLPLDVAIVDGRRVSKPIDAAARARAIQRLLCDGCVIKVRALKPDHIGDTATERHDRGLCANARGR